MFLIVGLGNPGKSYINNRHNVGYKVIDTLSDLYHSSVFSKKFKSEFEEIFLNMSYNIAAEVVVLPSFNIFTSLISS